MSHSAAADLLAVLDPLDYPTRSRRLGTETARLAANPAALDAVLDAFAAGGAYERELGLKMAMAAHRSDRVIAALHDPLHRIRALALYACVARPDAEADAAILGTVDDASLHWRRTVVRLVGAAKRTDLADRLAESYRDRLGDADTAKLLPVCSAKVAEQLLPDLAHELRAWSRFGTRHPTLMLDYARRELATVPSGARAVWWNLFGEGLVAAAEQHPDQVLDLLEEFPLPQGLPYQFLHQIGLLTRADETRTLRLLTVADGGLVGRWRSLSRTTRKRLASSGRPEVAVVGRAVADQPAATADLLRSLPPVARSEFYDVVTADREQDTAILDPAVLDALPRRRRHAEARRMLGLAAYTDRPDERLVVVARLPWDEARAELRTAVRRADAEERAEAYPLLVDCAAAEDHPPTITSLLTEDLLRLRNEQDPVRQAALTALAAVPARLFEDTAAVADVLRSLATDAIEARDFSWYTREALRRLACRVLAHQATDSRGSGSDSGSGSGSGSDSGSGLLLAWSLATFDRLAGSTGYFVLDRMDRDLRRGQELAVYRTLQPWIQRGIERRDHRLVLALAESLGDRARSIPGLQDGLAHAIWHGTVATAQSAIDLWLDDPAHRDTRVGQVVAWDPTAVAIPRVCRLLSLRRTDLLDPYLTAKKPIKGRFIAKGVIWVPPFRPSRRWLPRQLAAYAGQLAKIAADPGARIDMRVGAINGLGALPGEGQREVRRYLDSSEVPLVEAALRMLSRGQDPVADLPVLLGYADGDRARVAVYAAGRAARFARPSAAGPVLASVALSPTAKVTSRKEALRIAADIEIPGLVDLLVTVWRAPGQHRDVKAAAVLRLAARMNDDRVRALLREAVGDDAAIATQLLRMDPLHLPERHRAAYGDLIAAACDADDPKVAGAALAVAPRWYRWNEAAATAVCAAMTDLGRRGGRAAPPTALFALLTEGMPMPRYRAVLEALLDADAREDQEEIQGDAQGGGGDERDRPARRRLVLIAQAAITLRTRDRADHRALLAGTAQTLTGHPGYTRLASTLRASAVDLGATAEEVTGELLEIAASLSGRCDAAGQVGVCLADMVGPSMPWNPAAVLTAIRALIARDDPDAGQIAVRLVGAVGTALRWPEGCRSAVRALRRHSAPAVVEAALDLDIGAAAAV
ncbi:hypothetical protein [Catenulispora rubra]|uniref:hypothetical protein n=1 Tax=Catenulispora rubra TaxID=280293 RepID=UPI0018921979|nr:hypothetical protein [Catenulispora rubra]